MSPDGIRQKTLDFAGVRGSEDLAHAADLLSHAGSRTSAAAVSLMITKRQRLQLKELGFSDLAVAEMKPNEAHKHLGL